MLDLRSALRALVGPCAIAALSVGSMGCAPTLLARTEPSQAGTRELGCLEVSVVVGSAPYESAAGVRLVYAVAPHIASSSCGRS